MNEISIAIDVMGGDYGPGVTVPAALDFLREQPRARFLLVGDRNAIQRYLPHFAKQVSDRYQVLHTDSSIAMDEKPSAVLRHGRNSSMALALEQVRDGNAVACLSAGNTGALMILARSILGMQTSIDRPAFITEIPTLTGHCHMLDLGANVGCDAEHLYQFAIMGSIAASVVEGKEAPKVGLLNVGREQSKGNERVREAARMLQAEQVVNYIGFVEGDHIFTDQVDVIVCDGFVGNAALKASEGLAKMLLSLLHRVFDKNIFTRVAGKLCAPLLAEIVVRIDPRRHNGASLLGLNGIVVKSHGNADRESFKQSIRRAVLEVDKNLPSLIAAGMLRIKDRPAPLSAGCC